MSLKKRIVVILALSLLNFDDGATKSLWPGWNEAVLNNPGEERASNTYDEAFCLQQCQEQLLTEIAVQRASGAVNSTNSLDRYCSSVYPPAVSCFGECRKTVYRDLSLAQLDIGKFLCDDKKAEARKFYPCIERTISVTPLDVLCLYPCISNSSYVTYTVVNPKNKVSMNLNCRELKCNTKCQMLNIKNQCPSEGLSFARDYYKYIVKTYQKQIDIIQDRSDKFWPQDCADLHTELDKELFYL